MARTAACLSVWQIRYDLWSTRALLAVASPGGVDAARLEVQLFLADRYARLAMHHVRRGSKARARRLNGKARWHYWLGGFDGPPHTVALALPIPRPRLFVDARGRWFRRRSRRAA